MSLSKSDERRDIRDALRVLRSELDLAAPGRAAVVASGKFDGVHRGHHELIRVTSGRAEAIGAVAGAITFDPLPYVMFNAGRPYFHLTSLEERVALLKNRGADFVSVISFTEGLSRLSAAEFVFELRDRLGMVELVVGPDAALGHRREGTVDRLRELGMQLGFGVTEVAPVVFDGEPISTSRVRRLIHDGDVGLAAELLERPYAIEGAVVRGDQRGRLLGYPTANLLPPEGRVVPGDGIYACWASWSGGRRMAAVSIGVRPTFGRGLARLVEAYLIDFDGDLYGSMLRLEFVHRVRGEARFDSVDALVAQIGEDVETVRRVLS